MATTTEGGTTNFNLRVEQNMIQEFFGSKSKDTISAMDFIWQLGDLAKTNRWTDAQTYYYFANSLRMVSSMVDMNNEEPNQLHWSEFKDLFKQDYSVQMNGSLILEGFIQSGNKANGNYE